MISSFSVLLILTACGCADLKPAKSLMPQAFGVTCATDNICLDDIQKISAARLLAQDATADVEAMLGPIRNAPQMVFCSTTTCFQRFGNSEVAALYVWGTQTALFNDKGWQPHIVRHELIHHWQAENFGGLIGLSRLPGWYIEGMAYALSQDPRDEIPNATAQAQRETFEAWIAAGHDWRRPPT